MAEELTNEEFINCVKIFEPQRIYYYKRHKKFVFYNFNHSGPTIGTFTHCTIYDCNIPYPDVIYDTNKLIQDMNISLRRNKILKLKRNGYHRSL